MDRHQNFPKELALTSEVNTLVCTLVLINKYKSYQRKQEFSPDWSPSLSDLNVNKHSSNLHTTLFPAPLYKTWFCI